MPTLDEDDTRSGQGLQQVALRRAVTETLAILRMASAQWAQHGCPGTAECCQLSTTKREPWLWPSEWHALLDLLHRERRGLPALRTDGGCPFLDPAGLRCTVYSARPFGCRTFFCHRITGPAKQPAEASNALLERLTKLNVALDPASEPRAMLQWFARSPPSRPPEPPTPSRR